MAWNREATLKIQLKMLDYDLNQSKKIYKNIVLLYDCVSRMQRAKQLYELSLMDIDELDKIFTKELSTFNNLYSTLFTSLLTFRWRLRDIFGASFSSAFIGSDDLSKPISNESIFLLLDYVRSDFKRYLSSLKLQSKGYHLSKKIDIDNGIDNLSSWINKYADVLLRKIHSSTYFSEDRFTHPAPVRFKE